MILSKEKLERYAPLIGVFTAVISATLILAFTRKSFASDELMRSFMAFFFLTFGGFKAYNLSGFEEAFKMYDLIAKKSDIYAKLYPFIELGLGVSYLFLSFNSIRTLEIATHSITVLIMAIGAIGVLDKLKEREEIPCACLGNVFNIPMTWVTLGEDLLMAGMAAWMLITIL